MKAMFELILMSGILFFIVYLISIGRKKGEKTGVNKKNIEVALQELQVIWKGKERVEIELEKLVRIWKGYEEQEKEVLENVEFKHDEILEFYINYLRGRRWFKGRVKEVILEILKILDEKGEVSSVVKKGEVYELDNNTYELLMRVPLYRHSLNVAKKILGMGISGLSEPQAVICALGHDLGKIPEFFGQFYSLGDHPVVSVAVLKGIRGFLELPYAEAVEKAILYHHKAGKGKLVEYLKKADGLARKEEVEVEREKVNRERSRNKEGGREEEIRKDGVLSKSNQSQSSWERERNSERENSEGEEGEGVIEYDLSWLPIERFLKDLKGEINRVRDGRFIAFSMSDGVIYVHPQGLWNLIKKFAIEEKVMEILMMEGDKVFKRSVLIELVRLLRREGVIKEGLIKEGYFAAPFVVRRRGLEPLRVLYVPLRGEYFGSIGELEALKKGTKLEDIEKVEVDYSILEEE